MFAIIPVIILAGGLSVGAFDDTNILDTTDQTFADNIEMNVSTNKEVAFLDIE